MRNLALCFLLATLLAVSGCTSGSKVIVVSVASPSGAQALDLGQSFNISVSVSNDPLNKGVTWTLSGVGTLSNQTATGATYTAPATGAGGSATVTITSASDTTKSITLSIVVTAPPSITTASLAAAVMGTSYSGTVAVTGGAGTLNYSVTVGSLPAGLTLNATSGAITGTATGPTGTVNFTIQVKDSSTVSPQSTTKAFSITVNQAPSITSANSTAFTAGVAGSFTVTTTASPTASLAETGALPAGVTFVDNGNGTGTLSGTAATPGAYPITFTASNGMGSNATQNFTLNIQQAPAITSGNITTFTVGTAGTFSVTTSGFPFPTLTETGALPTGVTFKDNGNGTASLAGTPAASTGGTYSLSVKATNGVGSPATQTLTLTVDQGPAITSAASATFALGAAGSFSVTTTGLPTPSLSETGALPTGVTFVDNGNGTATLAGTPSGTAGAYSITIKATNSVSSATQSFTLTVGQSPAITSGTSTTFTVGTAGTFSVTTTGFPTPSLSETGALPTGVTFVDNGNGTATLAGTPAAATGGTYSLTIKAHNGAGADATQSFTLTVNQAPAFTSATSTSFALGAAGSFTVTTTGLPAPALIETGALPTGVTFTDNGNGTATLAGTPASGTLGTYSLTLKATNSVNSATQTFTLTVNSAPAISSAPSTTFTVGTAGTFSVTTTGFPTPSLSETGALPSGVTFVDNGNGTATLAGTPAAATGKAYSLTIKATNSVNNATQTFTLTVDQAPAITSANATTFSVAGAGSFSVTATGFPLPALTETGALPNGVTFVDNGNGTATLAGTPASGTAGSYPITVKATNIVSAITQPFTLTVDNGPVITSVNTYTFIQGTAGTFTVTTTGTPTPSITETGALPGGVTFTDNGNGTATLAGTVPTGNLGEYPLTIKATNSISTATQSFTLLVESVPVITSANNTTFTLGTAGSFTVTATGYPNVTLTETGALPTGVTFVPNGPDTALLSGTPAAGTNGTYTLTFTANNGVPPAATQTFTLTVVIPPLAISPSSGSLPPATENSSYTENLTASGGVPPYSFALTSSSNPLPAGLSLSPTTGQISGTPTSSGTFTFSVQVTDSALPTPNTLIANLSITVNSPGSQVSGQISLNNQCGGGPGSQPIFTVSINTTPVQTTTTDTSGNYSFATVPNGTYTITPSITGASSLFYPATLTNVVVSNNSVSGENFSAEVGYTVSGTVTYSASGTPQTGQTYISVTGGCNGGNGGPGTSISETTLTSGGAYTIRGVPPGSYTVQAWMDPLGQSVQNAIDPTGSASVTVTDANVTGAAITMHDPTFATPTSNPTIQGMIPNSQGVLIEFKPSQNSNSVEDANQYEVQWSTSPTLGGGTGGGQFLNIAGSHVFTASGDNGVWVLTNAVLTGSGYSFTSGQTYYFQARSFNTLDAANPHPTGWCNYTATGCSGTTGFTGVIIATPACTGTCTVVSSSVTIPAAITIKAGAPLYLGLLQFSNGSGGSPTGIYVTEIAHPSNGANDFTVTVPSGPNYAVLGILDQNNTGGIGVGAITNVRNNVQANLTISGSTQTVPGITLPTSNSIATVSTQFSSNSCQGCGSPSTGYQLSFNISESDKLPVAVVLNSGPNVLNTSGTVALDMGLCSQCGNPQFGYNVSLFGTPKVGDTYGFTVTYSDGTQDTGTTVAGAVTGWNGGATVVSASDAPTALAPNDTSSTSTTPTFTWTDSSSTLGANFSYSFYISQNTGCSGNCTIWQIPGNNSKSNGFSSSTTSITWGTDPTGGGSTPSVGSLTTGDVYNWSIQVQDVDGNSAQISVWYQP